ncbi:hypothetical protein [Planotetraspora sp. GP83]|uniref:hypothetical protein n=1 Tax=Planotetraspora sp. GP83 TaxID=3156264 RepID=UPI0035151F12
MGRRLLNWTTSWITLHLIAVAILPKTLLAEQNSFDPQAFRPHEPPGNLLPHEKNYIDGANVLIKWVIRKARNRQIGFMLLASSSGVAALAVTSALALQAPTWVPAVLASIAAFGQFLQALTRFREQALVGHREAVALQKCLRIFLTDAGELSEWELRRRFKEFRDEFEQIKQEHGDQIFSIRGQEPPAIPSAPRA